MVSIQGELGELVSLAKDRAKQSRRLLVENVADLFVSQEGRLSDRERSLMSDILGKLISEVENDVRKQLSQQLARLPDVPRDLVVQLANDDVDIAGPILTRSRVIQDTDLIEIIKRRSHEHRLVIAMREGLGEMVADALVEFGEEDVIEALINNHDAMISRQTMDYLVEESKRLDRFQEPLLHRPDLPTELAYRMYWWVSASLRKHILSEFDIDEGLIDQLIQESARQAIDTPVPALSETEELADALMRKGELTERFMVQALRAGRVSLFVAGLARLCDIDKTTMHRIVFDAEGAALVVAWRACDFERQSFAAVYLLTRQAHDDGQASDPNVLTDILDLFDSTTIERARAAVKYWMHDSGYVAAIEALEQELQPAMVRL